MPEVTEVTKAAIALNKSLVGVSLLGLSGVHPNMDLQPDSASVAAWLSAEHPKVTSVQSHAKYLIIRCDKCVILSHFKFTGWWIPEWTKAIGVEYFIEGNPQDRIASCSRAQFTTSSGVLHWVDQRLLGLVAFYSHESFKTKSPHLKLGPPINTSDFTFDLFQKYCSSSKKQIGEMLLDQEKFSGIGNWMRAEILYIARQHPEQPANTISKERVEFLYQTILAVYALGMQENNYAWWNVFQRAKDHVGNPVVRLPRGARGLYYCPAVQKYWE